MLFEIIVGQLKIKSTHKYLGLGILKYYLFGFISLFLIAFFSLCILIVAIFLLDYHIWIRFGNVYHIWGLIFSIDLRSTFFSLQSWSWVTCWGRLLKINPFFSQLLILTHSKQLGCYVQVLHRLPRHWFDIIISRLNIN